MVGYSGWNAATYVAEEVRRPERTLPAALAAGTAIVAVLYVGLNLIFIYATPLEAMKRAPSRVRLALRPQSVRPASAASVPALMALCLMSTVNAEVTVGPRVYYAMAKNRAFFAAAARVHPRWHTPVVAIVSQGLCAILMTATPFPDLVIYIGMSLTLFTVFSVASLFVFRRQPGWQTVARGGFRFPADSGFVYPGGAGMVIFGSRRETSVWPRSRAVCHRGARARWSTASGCVLSRA